MIRKSHERTGGPEGHFLVLAAAVLWGTTGTALAFAPPGAEPAAVGAVRIAVGGLALFAVAALRGEFRAGGVRWPPLATATAALGVAAYQPLFFAGVTKTGVALGTISAIGSAPVWTSAIGFLFLDEKPTVRWGIATALAVSGCALLLGAGGGVSVDAAGSLLALSAGACYAVYATASKRLLAEGLPHVAVMAVVFSAGAVLLCPLLATSDLGWLAEPRGAAVALELGLVATALAYASFARGLTVVPVRSAATLSLAEPLTAGLLGVLVLGEGLSVGALLGAGLMLGGLGITSVGREAPPNGRQQPGQAAGAAPNPE
jgi:DME family drug/metabolite transporter